MAVTFTANVHDASAASVAPAKLRLFVPAGAVIVPPSHDPVRPLGVEVIRPDGSTSKNVMPDKATEFGFVMVKLNSVVSPAPGNSSCESANDFVIVGGITTATVAVADKPMMPWVSVTLLVALFWAPAAVAVTLILNVQDAPGASVAPAPPKLTEPDPAVAVIIPGGHDPLRPFGVDTTKPPGNVSVKARPV